jgi:hypothetical protein
MSDLKKVRVFVLAQGGDGPEVFETDVLVSESDYNHGWHYDVAQKQAKSAGLDTPMMAFDEFDPAASRFKPQTPASLQSLLTQANDVSTRLVDSEAHAVDDAVPPVAVDAAQLIRQLADVVASIGKAELEKTGLRRIIEQVVFGTFLSEAPDDLTIASIRAEMAKTSYFPDGMVVAEAFEDLSDDQLFEAMSDLANSFEGAIEHAKAPEVIPSRVAVSYWNDQKPVKEREFFMEVTDQRNTNSQMYVDIAPIEGDIDDIMSLTLEINRLPDDDTDRQCAHLHFDGSNMAVSIFKDNDRYIVRPETDVRIHSTQLNNGELAYIIE